MLHSWLHLEYTRRLRFYQLTYHRSPTSKNERKFTILVRWAYPDDIARRWHRYLDFNYINIILLWCDNEISSAEKGLVLIGTRIICLGLRGSFLHGVHKMAVSVAGSAAKQTGHAGKMKPGSPEFVIIISNQLSFYVGNLTCDILSDCDILTPPSRYKTLNQRCFNVGPAS